VTLQEGAPFVLVAGGEVATPDLAKALTHATLLVAADGGADALLAAGLVPDLVVGDMDSISDPARAAFADRLRPVAEQDSTDLAKALAAAPGPALILGASGGRVDHLLAALSTLAEVAAAGRAPCVMLGPEDCACVLPAAAEMTLMPGDRVSLWPMGPATARSEGLEWPLDGIAFAPDARVGTSNRATAARVRIEARGAPMLLLLGAHRLEAMLALVGFPPRPGRPPAL
jgi:thiamine pyrophosphokinase